MGPRRRAGGRPRPPALVACELTKAYGDLVALAPLSLEVPTGQAVALTGDNGSGKSTLLQLAAGLLEPTDGSIAVEGRPAGSLDARRSVSYIGDTPVLYDDLSVREHLEYLAGLRDVDDWEDRSRSLLERFGLTDRADDLPGGFSRGLRQKTALTIGLVWDAPVVLVDEPFVGLDAGGRAALLDLFDERRTQGSTIVVATHDAEILGRVDRGIVLADGQVVHDGLPDDATAATAPVAERAADRARPAAGGDRRS